MKFDSYHPMINLIYFVSVIFFTISFNQPVFVAIAYVSAFVYSVKLNKVKALIFNLCLIPFIGIYTAWYSYYNHFGITNLHQNIVGNEITLEAVAYGLERGVTVATVIMILSCMFAVFSSDKIVYLFGKISPKLSLFLSIILRSVPRIKQTARKINIAQKGLGRGAGQGGFIGIIRNSLRVFSILVTWTIESFMESSQSMKNRGYSLRGRTAFSIYRFDNRDRTFVIAIFLNLTLILAAWAFDQTNMYYNPMIAMNKITPVCIIFYAAYGFLFLMPMGLQIIGEIRFKYLNKC